MKKIFWMFLLIATILVFLILGIFAFFPRKYDDLINKYSRIYNVESAIVASVINIESSYRKNCVSNAGAIGLMQLLPSTAHDMASRLDVNIENEDLYNEEINIKLGVFYLSYLFDMFDGNLINTLAAYNWGMNNVKEWINRGNCDNGTIINIPVEETRNYLKKFNSNYFIYKNIYKLS